MILMLRLPVLIGACLAAGAFAQPYPTKPVRLISPYAAGGGSDTLARIVGQRLSEGWGQPVVIENRPGAAGSVGAEIAARAQADGYTALVTPSAVLTINPHLYSKLGYDPLRDFAPVTAATNSPYLLVTHPSVPARNVKELVAYARANPNKLAYSSSGNGSSTHLAGVLFAGLASAELLHVPYKGSGPATIDIIAGRIQMRFSSVVPALPHVRSGKLNGLGISSAKRYGPLPDTPTVAEAGLPGFVVESFYAIVVPARTPRAVIAKLNADIVRHLANDEMRARMAADGAEVIASTPEVLGTLIRDDLARWAKPVKDSGARVD